MGFLDHSTNNIIIDAVLTEKGRELLAAGTFSAESYAFSDTEIDYTLLKKYGVAIGKEKIEKNTPILEASTISTPEIYKWIGDALRGITTYTLDTTAKGTVSLNSIVTETGETTAYLYYNPAHVTFTGTVTSGKANSAMVSVQIQNGAATFNYSWPSNSSVAITTIHVTVGGATKSDTLTNPNLSA